MPGDTVGRRGEVAMDPGATAAVPAIRSSADLLKTHQADMLCEQFALQPGESAVVTTRGPGAGSLLRLGSDVVSLGRSTTATMLLDDISVSRHHAEIRAHPAGYRIVDLGSLNGTYVNDTPVEEALLLHADDIRIGRFRLCFLTTAPGPRGAPVEGCP